jgi:hypothetical protein
MQGNAPSHIWSLSLVLGTAVLVLAAVMTAIFALAGRAGGLSLKDRIGVIPIEGAIYRIRRPWSPNWWNSRKIVASRRLS